MPNANLVAKNSFIVDSYLDHVKWYGVDHPCFQCQLCPKNYTHKQDLTGHLKNHEKKSKGK